MKEYFDCLIMSHGTAFGAGAGIFLLTILLVARRIVGFVLSIILLLIALGASWAVNNEAFVRSHLDKWIPSTQGSSANRTAAPAADKATTPAAPKADTPAGQQPEQGSDNLKGKVDEQKARVQNYLDEKSK